MCLAAADDTTFSLEFRVRSYLAANCVQCHQPGGPATANFDTRITVPLSQAGLVDGTLNDDFGDTNNRVVVPGSLTNSMLHQRVAGLAGSIMPPLGTTVLDTNSINLLSNWIGSAQLLGYQTFAQWQITHFGSTVIPSAQPEADPDGDSLRNELEHLLGKDPNVTDNDWKLEIQRTNGTAQLTFPHLAYRGFDVQWKTSITNPVPWQSLNVPANKPFISSSNFTAVVEDDLAGATNKTYRVRVYEP
jgi:hypothetical protein